ncbi:hypothetical protein [Nitrosopumilus sp.]|uniref:hypothetical protein n=1 Tax=Nitrosopumilus sp. TaxID=2024843 RepID=UPI00247BF319|nr:hypothetical protein [Nitrosopumilus sp.]MCV0429977.1 hypothetical protein [Nitrosopumilus sp.]
MVLIRKNAIMCMSRRVTIMIEDDIDKKIRAYQAKKIQKENSAHSYSKVVNELLRKAI